MILTVNGGSSTLKCALFNEGDELTLAAHRDARLSEGGEEEAVAALLAWQSAQAKGRPVRSVAHRVVHGGEVFDRPCRLTPHVPAALDGLTALAPNHLPAELAFIRACMSAMPEAVHVACFDTAFHRTLPDVARVLPLPGVRRFGFHGLS